MSKNIKKKPNPLSGKELRKILDNAFHNPIMDAAIEADKGIKNNPKKRDEIIRGVAHKHGVDEGEVRKLLADFGKWSYELEF